MKKVEFITLLILCMSFAISCDRSEDEFIEEETSIIDVQTILKRNRPQPQRVLYWLSGTSKGNYVDGFRVAYDCLGIGGCGPFIATIDPVLGTVGVPILANVESDDTLVIELLDEHVTMNEVINAIDTNAPQNAAQTIYDILNTKAIFEGEVTLDLEVSNALLGDMGQEIVVLPGEYQINYNNSQYGEIRLQLRPITDPEKEDKEKSNKKAKNENLS